MRRGGLWWILLAGTLAAAQTVPPITTDPGKPPAGGPTSAKPGDGKPAGAKDPAKPDTPRKAVVHTLAPGSVVKTGKDRSVVARGKLQLVLPDDDVIVYCNAVDYSGESTGVATVTGDLRIESGKVHDKDGISVIDKPENVVTGAIAWVFTKEKRAVIDGDLDPKVEAKVIVVHTPKEQKELPPDADRVEKTKNEPTTLRCDRLTYWYRKGDRKAVAQAKLPNTTIAFEQPKQRGTAGKATYYEIPAEQGDTGDVLDLEGGVKAANDDGEHVEAGAARVFVDQETSQWFEVTKVEVNVSETGGKPKEGNTPPPTPGSGPATPATPGAPPAAPGGAGPPPEPGKPPAEPGKPPVTPPVAPDSPKPPA